MTRINVGEQIERRTVEAIDGASLTIPDDSRATHLQFRRYSGCPMCNLHIRSFVQRHDELARNGIREIAVFHSSTHAMRKYHAEAPFPVIADPARSLYRAFGVEASILSVLHPKAWLASIKGVLSGRFGMPAFGESPFGLPADFLIDPGGVVLAAKYGAHAYDHWSVDEVIALAARREPVGV